MTLTFTTVPSGLARGRLGLRQVTPFTRTVIQVDESRSRADAAELNGTQCTFAAVIRGRRRHAERSPRRPRPRPTPPPTRRPAAARAPTASATSAPPRPGRSSMREEHHNGAGPDRRRQMPCSRSLCCRSRSSCSHCATRPPGSTPTAWLSRSTCLSEVGQHGAAEPGAGQRGRLRLPRRPRHGSQRVWCALPMTGTAPNRQFVVEWRNGYIYGSTSRRITFEAILSENGDVITNYARLDNDIEKGNAATIGIENADGSVGLAGTGSTPRSSSPAWACLLRPRPAASWPPRRRPRRRPPARSAHGDGRRWRRRGRGGGDLDGRRDGHHERLGRLQLLGRGLRSVHRERHRERPVDVRGGHRRRP